MAKRSKIAAQHRREEVVARYAARRAELKEAQRAAASPEEASRVAAELQRLPRDASPTRLRNRDAVDGRPRGYVRAIGLSRVRFRAEAHAGHLPGITKSSW